MIVTPSAWAVLVTMVLVMIYVAHRDDPRFFNWLKAQWSNTVGAWFAKRRMRIRVEGAPDEHSPGIMVSRRDINTGNWT